VTGPGKPWFAPKRFGYGAGLPIAWQGWVLFGPHLALLLGAALLLPGAARQWRVPLILLIAFAPLPLYAAKTEGGWHWRW